MTNEPEDLEAEVHHQACDGRDCDMFECEKLAGVLKELKGADCTFWACEGPDVPPENMVTCSVHWAYFSLKEVMTDA